MMQVQAFMADSEVDPDALIRVGCVPRARGRASEGGLRPAPPDECQAHTDALCRQVLKLVCVSVSVPCLRLFVSGAAAPLRGKHRDATPPPHPPPRSSRAEPPRRAAAPPAAAPPGVGRLGAPPSMGGGSKERGIAASKRRTCSHERCAANATPAQPRHTPTPSLRPSPSVPLPPHPTHLSRPLTLFLPLP